MRRRHGTPSRSPRAWARVHGLPANGEPIGASRKESRSPPVGDGGTLSSKLANGLLGRLRALISQLVGLPGSQVCVAQPSREARLQAVAFKLEAILDELDEIGTQRIAIDVCMALERVKAQLVTDDATTPPEPVGDR